MTSTKIPLVAGRGRGGPPKGSASAANGRAPGAATPPGAPPARTLAELSRRTRWSPDLLRVVLADEKRRGRVEELPDGRFRLTHAGLKACRGLAEVAIDLGREEA